MPEMKLFRFSDYHNPNNIYDSFVVDGENLYYFFNVDHKFELRPSARGYWFSGIGENDHHCILRKSDNNILYDWNIINDKVTKIEEIPLGFAFYTWLDGFRVFRNKSSISNQLYSIFNISTDKRIVIETGRGGSIIYCNDDLICYFDRGECNLVMQDYEGKILWSRKHDKAQSHICAWPEESKIIVSQRADKSCTITILDMYSGAVLLNYKTANMWIMSCHFDNEFAYIRCKNNLIVYDVLKNAIVHDVYSDIHISAVHTQGDRLYLLTAKPITIAVYNKFSLAKLLEKQITAMDAHSGLMATTGSRHMLAIYSDIPEESRGFTWMCYFTDDELFADDWQVDFEPAYYSIEEQDDFSGGVSLKVTFDTDIDFDTLYRHVSTGLQTAAFRNGIHRFTEGKSHNERFNGTVIANFEDHVFSDEQKELIEDLCERTTKYFQEGMSLLSGDGSQLCHVTSIIPTTYTGT